MSSQHVTRLRRESRPEAPIGKFVTEAAVEADNRVARAIAGPPPTEAEAEILAAAAHEPVRLYSRVSVTDLESGEQVSYRIVPEDEADFERGALSISSAIGRALLMEYPGAVVAVKAPGGERLFRLLRVEG
ncbi:MAG TPA: GreA/GreB family elongation factor [Symbiobacteriaceae bacterium]|jgi:transcription elongation factor GreA|nr:GreA/GreB family elongation factor [Symbiobacteriaceae bacterium]